MTDTILSITSNVNVVTSKTPSKLEVGLGTIQVAYKHPLSLDVTTTFVQVVTRLQNLSILNDLKANLVTDKEYDIDSGLIKLTTINYDPRYYEHDFDYVGISYLVDENAIILATEENDLLKE